MYHRKYAHPTYVRAHTKNTPVYKGQKECLSHGGLYGEISTTGTPRNVADAYKYNSPGKGRMIGTP